MQIEIDQSGRIEETQRDTVIAIANKDLQFSFRVNRKIKKHLHLIYKKRDRRKLFAIRTFAVSVALLIQRSKLKPDRLIIDIEYPGHENLIKEIIQEVLGYKVSVIYKNIGKSSPAHIKAYFTFKNKLKEDFVAREKEMLNLAIKKDRGRKST